MFLIKLFRYIYINHLPQLSITLFTFSLDLREASRDSGTFVTYSVLVL